MSPIPDFTIRPADNADLSSTAAGLAQLQQHCNRRYPQETPIIWKSEKSFITNGGHDFLDTIHIYRNHGDLSKGFPKHWHYVGFGLSDTYGIQMLCELDKRMRATNSQYAATPPVVEIYPPQIGSGAERKSGFGFELTFRVQCDNQEQWEQEPPEWPRLIMQELAKYVFKSKNVFSVGDHIAWDRPLDKDSESSRIKHMLMTDDPQFDEVITSSGVVKFIQLVGVCEKELQAAREWYVLGVLDIMSRRVETGGELLVTDMLRGMDIFELDPENNSRVERGIAEMGSDLTSMSAKHKYSSRSCPPSWWSRKSDSIQNNSDQNEDENEPMEEDEEYYVVPKEDPTNMPIISDNQSRNPSRMSLESESKLLVENVELADIRYYKNMYLLLTLESARVLPVVLKGRLAYRRPFTFKSFNGDLVTTFVPDRSVDSLVSNKDRFARQGVWLQIFMPDDLIRQMGETFDNDPHFRNRNYSWPDFNFHITVVKGIIG